MWTPPPSAPVHHVGVGTSTLRKPHDTALYRVSRHRLTTAPTPSPSTLTVGPLHAALAVLRPGEPRLPMSLPLVVAASPCSAFL
jgi:hypothetical protein